MTVIAYKAGVLAVDRLGNSGGLAREVSKMMVATSPTGVRYAMTGCGNSSELAVLQQWYKDGACVEHWPEFQTKEEHSTLVILNDNGNIFFYDHLPIAKPVIDEYFAWGSGREVALGAMYMGASAREAVEAAMAHVLDCGIAVDYFDTIPF